MTRMRLRSHLLLLSAATAAPILALAVVVAFLVVRQERDTLRDAAKDRVIAIMSGVDAELRGSIATMRALAASAQLESGDLAAFHAEAMRILKAHPDWLDYSLNAPNGARVASSLPAAVSAQTALTDRESFDLAVTTGEPVVGSLAEWPNGQRWAVPLRMPVMENGLPKYILTAMLRPDAFSDLLRAQRLPEGWIAGIADRKGRFIGRLPPVPPGQYVSDNWRERMKRSTQGWFRGRTIEGREMYTPYATSSLSGWALGIAMPPEAVEAAAWRSLWLVLAMVLLASGIAIGLALLLGWRIAKPIAALAQAAEAAGRGQRVAFPVRTPITELDSLSAALAQAAQAMHDKHQLAEREKAALQASDRAKDEFLAMLSHELRNPLAALTAAAHVLKLAAPGDAAAIKARGVVDRQTKHMARLVGDLLDISRVAMGKVALERERFNLAEAAANVVHVWRASGRLERHQLAVEIKPAWVDADRARIEQILSNLLDNAVKFTPAGRRITVSVGQEADWAVLQVSDQGEGLAPGSADRMFDLFVQGERGLDRAAGGLGVGLALVKRLSEMHGGSVSAESAGPGRGATFRVTLPAVQPATTRTGEVAAAPVLAPRRVLIVEDNDDARQMLHDVLAFGGHDVREARDGASGLALAAQSPPDVALIDIGLPDVNGYEVARRLRASPGGRRMGLIAITGYGQAEDQRLAYEAGFDAHLTKPVAPERLKQVMAGLQ
jgi:signal transduction histidine kinase